MQNDNIEILTNEQLRFLRSMNIPERIEALHYLANELLGLITVSEFRQISNERPRTIYDHIEKGKLKTEIFCNQKMIIMNS